MIESEKFKSSPSLLTLALGKDIHGEPVVDDLRAMPHLLIAGTTGSGKSVGINALITSVIFKARPDQVRMILIDPKMVELEMYENLPHLATPIITDPKKAANALRWAVAQMEERFQTLSDFGQVRNAEQYNAAIQDPEAVARVRAQHPEDPDLKLEPMPLILIVIDQGNIGRVVSAGATMIVAGSSIFGTKDPASAVRTLKGLAVEAAAPGRR